MPVKKGKDKGGSFFRWGHKGKKYYYEPNNPHSRMMAKYKALLQGRAIEIAMGGYHVL